MHNRRATSILLIEDDPEESRLIHQMFDESLSWIFALSCVESTTRAESYLAEHSVDVILLDLGVGGQRHLASIARMRALAPRVAIVLLAGAEDEAIAIRAIREGAQYYLIKGQIEPRELMGSLLKSAELKALDELSHSAQHDFLTGLPNRALLNDRVNQAMALAHRQKCQAAVLFLDLDGFKQINDSLGHHIGDKVLQSVAKRLVNCLRVPDTVCRFGGDEFVVVLQELKHPEKAATTANRLLRAVAAAHSIDQLKIYLTASAGVSVYPGDGMESEKLIVQADAAMYCAKRDGKHAYRFFRPEMIAEPNRRKMYKPELGPEIIRNESVSQSLPEADLRMEAIDAAEDA